MNTEANNLELIIHHTIWNYNSVLPLSELLEDNSVRETLPADTDPFQDSIATKLIQNQVWIQFSSLWRKDAY